MTRTFYVSASFGGRTCQGSSNHIMTVEGKIDEAQLAGIKESVLKEFPEPKPEWLQITGIIEMEEA